MNVSILTLFPQLYKEFLQTSLLKKAQEKKMLSFFVQSMFDYAQPGQRIDASTYGHSSGMLIQPQIIEKAVDAVDGKFGKSFKIILSPQGRKLDQHYTKQLWDKVKSLDHLMILASRYEGIDHRVEEHYADEIISVGDFVTMGGDIPAMLLIEALFRHMPGIVGKQESVDLDSFTGAFVDHPEYTKPIEWKGMTVPEVLRSGNHAAISAWRKDKAVELTVKKHFDWLRSSALTEAEMRLAQKHLPSHYVALMHSDMKLKDGRIGTTSVTSIDLHDIARSCSTYGVKKFFVVTPLEDQKTLMQKVLDFWVDKDVGGAYNQHRHVALERVKLESSLTKVMNDIKEKEGKLPIVIGTSALDVEDATILTYYQQSIAWSHDQPILFLLGTGHGMSKELIDRCDYMLTPLKGFSDYNHLSVRSAAAIILDKWFGFSVKK